MFTCTPIWLDSEYIEILIRVHHAELFVLPVAKDVDVRGDVVVVVVEGWGSRDENCDLKLSFTTSPI